MMQQNEHPANRAGARALGLTTQLFAGIPAGPPGRIAVTGPRGGLRVGSCLARDRHATFGEVGRVREMGLGAATGRDGSAA